MNKLWPRLPLAVTSELGARVRSGKPLVPMTAHPSQTYGSVGPRARDADVQQVRETLLTAAQDQGFPDRPIAGDAVNIFDRSAGRSLARAMPMSWSEAAQRDVWNFTTLVMAPDVTAWRWSSVTGFTEERWIAHDLMRHTWSRLWWQATTFAGHEDLLDEVQESELNQLFERRQIGGQPQLVVAATQALLTAFDEGASRRSVTREFMKRLLRMLAYMDTTAMTTDELHACSRRLVLESIESLRSQETASAIRRQQLNSSPTTLSRGEGKLKRILRISG